MSILVSTATEQISTAEITAQINNVLAGEGTYYKGLWNAETNIPDLNNLDPAPKVGDFYRVFVQGMFD